MKSNIFFKKYFLLFLFCTSIVFSSRYFIDTEKSNVIWIGRKVSGEHHGVINIKGGYVDIEKKSIVGGEIVIDMKSIEVVDMSDKYNRKLEKHLKNSDFFDVDLFPESTFKIKKNHELITDENILFEGDLTIKDTTIISSIPSKILLEDNIVKAIGIVDIDRTLYGITYGSGAFFEDLTDRAIDDNFTLKFKIFADRNFLSKPIIDIIEE